MNSFRNIAVVLCALMLAASTSFAQEQANPEYTGWSKQKPGAWVKHKMVSDAGGQKTEMEMTTKLIELTADKAVVETASVMNVGGQKIDVPGMKRDVPAKWDPAKANPNPNAPKPEIKEGSEDVTVGGKSYKCKTYETTMKSDQATMTSKTWMSDDVPGGTVKMESKMEKPIQSVTTMEVVGFEAGK
jgi:hypothetical protein